MIFGETPTNKIIQSISEILDNSKGLKKTLIKNVEKAKKLAQKTSVIPL